MRFWMRIGGVAIVVIAAAVFISTNLRSIQGSSGNHKAMTAAAPNASAYHPPTLFSVISKQHKLTFMAVGGSTAQGYDDPKLDGYLKRALSSVSQTLKVPVTFVNKAKSGKIPSMLAPEFDPLVHQIKPNVVMISWGLLNSIAKKVPQSMFQRVIESEIKMSLRDGADVWVITPPVTPATYVGHDVKVEPEFINLELAAVKAVNNPNVHFFNLNSAMKTYLQDHHLSYKPLESNNWHMNGAGHELAGKILANHILQNEKELGLSSL